MVKIHKCKKCNQDIYYKPNFSGVGYGYSGYTTSFDVMNLDKTLHNCETVNSISWMKYEEQVERAERNSKDAWNNYLEFIGRDW